MPADNINEPLVNNSNVDELARPSFTGRASSLTCGAIARVSLQVDDVQTIRDAKFKVAGCTVLVAALSNLTEQAKGKTTAEAAILAEDLKSIEAYLENVPVTAPNVYC